MTTSEERLQILKMVETGQITAEEAAELLAALEEASKREDSKQKEDAPRWFRVRVTDMRTGKSKVNVNIPMGLAGIGMRMGAKFAPDMAGIDIDELMRNVREGSQGKIIDVENEEDGEHVEIYVE